MEDLLKRTSEAMREMAIHIHRDLHGPPEEFDVCVDCEGVRELIAELDVAAQKE
jgi:hypothetical protein